MRKIIEILLGKDAEMSIVPDIILQIADVEEEAFKFLLKGANK